MGSIGPDHHDPQLATALSSNEAADMATLDCSKLKGSPSERSAALKQLDEALQSYGFIYLANHGVSQTLFDEAFAWINSYSERFFDLDSSTKNMIARPASESLDDHYGYAAYGVGHISQLVFGEEEVEKHHAASPDHKETLEVGNPHEPCGSGPNRWLPEDVFPGFRQFYEVFWDACNEVEKSLRQALCEILRIDINTLCRKQSLNFGHISFLHYPQMAVKSQDGKDLQRLNAHTDYGSLTLVFQDNVGGLEVHDGQLFRPVTPKTGTIVVNVGDMLEQQSNGRWKSALHQVVGPRKETMGEGLQTSKTVLDRYSIAYTGAVDPEVIIETLPGCEVPGRWKPSMADCDEEKPVTSYEWLQKRVAAEYHQT
ncbi:uncharacterized protein APUU_20317A [Aspergillus puulaauensis]|uniref:Fe2OG dioxygenase domain-containing protein n=1 Tax=Aspergillus puulaauensis TaxID=1220207 RepID=A0A7R8AJQ0_9EURO|nr:uncharacterized protein APUU_20317A [Aspergillus puulaauensis]BCS19885.1 hypothetical protein APUU_20317A [Aspergillus puulaauensis]